MLRLLRILFWGFFILAVVYVVLSLRPYSVSGDSMYPVFESGQIVIIDRLSMKLSPLRRGDVIVYRDMENDGETRVKRVIGLPGEKIEIGEWKVMLMRKEISEPYLGEHVRTCLPGACTDLGWHKFDVPEKSYFVLGDNRGTSKDSRGCPDVADCRDKKTMYVPDVEILWRVIFSW
jgi:signal peptidase I